MMRKKFAILPAIGLSALVTAPAAALPYMQAGGDGVVFTKTGDLCALEYDRDTLSPTKETSLKLEQASGQPAKISLRNMRWSPKPRAAYEVTIQMGQKVHLLRMIGGVSNDLTAEAPADFLRDFAAGRGLVASLQRDGGEFGGILLGMDLRETAKHVQLLDRCVKLAKLENEYERINPVDPFASVKPVEFLPRAPLVKGNPGTWANTSDYPPAALREEREGRVDFRLTVGIDGRVADCLVTSSSGHVDLDEATCASMQRRARFEPALDESGKPVVGYWESALNWRVPR